jgi:hypothetical protein
VTSMDPEILSAPRQHPTDASYFRSQAHQTAAVGAAALKLGRSYHALNAKAQPQAARIAPRFLAPWTQSRRCLPPSLLSLSLSLSFSLFLCLSIYIPVTLQAIARPLLSAQPPALDPEHHFAYVSRLVSCSMGVEGGEAAVIAVPAMGDSITEGTVVKWHFQVGDQVEMDDIMCEVETDKV